MVKYALAKLNDEKNCNKRRLAQGGRSCSTSRRANFFRGIAIFRCSEK